MYRYTWKTTDGERVHAELKQLRAGQVEELLEILGAPGDQDVSDLLDGSIMDLIRRAVGSERIRQATAAILDGADAGAVADMPLEILTRIWFEDFFLCYPRTGRILLNFAGSMGFRIQPLPVTPLKKVIRRLSSCMLWLRATRRKWRRSGSSNGSILSNTPGS